MSPRAPFTRAVAPAIVATMRASALTLLGPSLLLALACAPGGDPGDTDTTTLAATTSGAGTTAAATTSAGTGTDDPTTGASTSSTTAPGTTTDASTTAANTSTTTGDATASTTTDPSGTTDASTTAPDTTGGGMGGLVDVGSLVVLGDSISDGGGQPPFYYDLLRADLEAKYGPIQYENHAQSGSKTDALLGQAKGLPAQLAGPVVVVITSGGNDMKAALPQILGGLDGPIKAGVAANIDKALAELLAPGRFGPGVDVHVFEGNVYDASDGQGNYSQGKCAFGQGLPPIPTGGYFDAWNATIRDAVLAHAQDPVDMHMHFADHGFNHPPNWYAADCTHPSTLGHDQLRRLFYFHVTGEMLP